MFKHYKAEIKYRSADNFMAKILCAFDVYAAEKLAKEEGKSYEEAMKYMRYVRATNRVNRRISMGVSVDGLAPWVFAAIEEY